MKYINKSLFLSIALALPAIPAMAQETTDADISTPDQVQVAFRQVDKQAINGGVSVYNPEDYSKTNYNRYVKDGLSGYVNGLENGTSIWGMNEALVLIDGVPRSMDDVTMDEVEQITVLKGANAVVLYGAQAAKGAILITTKRGQSGDRKISLKIQQGISEAKSYPSYLNSADYMTLYNEARQNDGLDALYSTEKIANYRNGSHLIYPDVDYFSDDYLNRFAYNTDGSAEFTGGSENAQFYSEIGFHQGTSLLKVGEADNEKDTRFNVRGNVDMRINDFITSSVDASVILYSNRTGLGDYWGAASSIQPQKYVPLIPVSAIESDDLASQAMAKASRNLIGGKYLLGGSQEYLTTPFSDLYAGGYNDFKSRNFQFLNTINIDLDKVLKGLNVVTRFNVDYATSYSQSINNSYAVYQASWKEYLGETVLGQLTKYGNDSRSGTQNISNSASRRNIGFTVQANYKADLGQDHKLTTTLVGVANNVKQSGIFQPYTNSHVGLSADYSYKNRYYANFSGAMMSSSKLPSANRLGFSPTASLGWVMSQEDFMKEITWIDYLKVNASAASVKTDLDITDYYLYDNAYNQGDSFTWDDGSRSNNASTSQRGQNDDFKFATRNELTLGFDALLFKNRLNVHANVFMVRMEDMPEQAYNAYPGYYNDFVPFDNSACNEYRGLDFAIDYKEQFGKVTFNAGLNMTYAATEVIDKDELYLDSYQNRVGKPINAMFGLETEGFFDSEEEIAQHAEQTFGQVQPGDLKYKDQNNDGIIDSKDEVEIGNWSAPCFFGLNLSAGYKHFTLFLQATGQFGGDSMKNSDYYWVDGDDKYSDEVLNRWAPETKESASYPRLSANNNPNNFRSSDFWTYSTDRINISKIQLTYEMPSHFLKGTFVKNLLFYVNGSNLLTIAKNKSTLDLNVGSTPQMRYYNLGFSANF